MATLQQQLERARKLSPANITDILFDFLRSIEPQLAQLNRDQLFESSSDIFGNPLGYYTLATEEITTAEALLGYGTIIKYWNEPYDFKQKGNFLKGIFAKASDGFITFNSSDPKTDDILSNVNLLSKEFFGLTDEHKRVVITTQILPHLNKVSRQELGI